MRRRSPALAATRRLRKIAGDGRLEKKQESGFQGDLVAGGWRHQEQAWKCSVYGASLASILPTVYKLLLTYLLIQVILKSLLVTSTIKIESANAC